VSNNVPGCRRAQVQRGYVVTKRYQVLPPTAPVPAPDDVLEMVTREGARKLLQAMLEAEVDDFLGRRRYQRIDENRGYRNGHLLFAPLASGWARSRSVSRE
jgi:hypothetical protein